VGSFRADERDGQAELKRSMTPPIISARPLLISAWPLCPPRLAAFLSIGVLFFAFAATTLPMADARAQQAIEKLQIVTASGPHDFSVEVMRTEPELEKGLMFRRFLPADRGMLFDFKQEKPVMMWMKNTYLPLDMVFIARSGKVVGIAANAEPMSERIIPSGAPAYGVLEVNAGTAEKIGLKIGDEVHHPMFKN
jgi:uncharacterized membrane protein (UPF0127 family)